MREIFCTYAGGGYFMWIYGWPLPRAAASPITAVSLSRICHITKQKTAEAIKSVSKKSQQLGRSWAEGVGAGVWKCDAKRAAQNRHNILEASLENEYW